MSDNGTVGQSDNGNEEASRKGAKAQGLTPPMPPRLRRSSGWDTSCDFCTAQEEGGHYCLLHTRQLKNMDTLTCDDWELRASMLQPAGKARGEHSKLLEVGNG